MVLGNSGNKRITSKAYCQISKATIISYFCQVNEIWMLDKTLEKKKKERHAD